MFYRKGVYKEQQHSRQFHQIGIAVLVSSKFLRSRGAGQIDLARYRPWDLSLEIAEVKSAKYGFEVSNISFIQFQRLKKSCELISQLLGVCGKIILR